MKKIPDMELATSALRLYLVDDSLVFLNAALNFFRHQENIEVVGTGTDAVTAITETKELQPDVILLDLDMPDINGLKAIPLLKRFTPKSRIIILSLLESALDQKIALEAGADDYVPKSVMYTQLMPAILQL